jgi:hypothetical protein
MKIKMICQSPTDRNRVTWIDSHFAWAAARGIATWTHQAVILYGEFGTARFDRFAGGYIEWNEKSTKPGVVDFFDDKTQVCI